MSRSAIVLVPCQRGFVPDDARCREALASIQAMLPPDAIVGLVRHEGIELFDCGENFLDVRCPACGVSLDTGDWGDLMDADYNAAAGQGTTSGFRLQARPLPCCGASHAVDELVYDWPMAFGKFAITLDDPAIGQFTPEQLSAIEGKLGCGLVMVLRHT